MAKVLEMNGFRGESGMYLISSDQPPALSGGERTVMLCFERCGPVVYHSELLDAFLEGGYSLPLLHPTLRHSPLFVRMGKGLYKVRGTRPTAGAVERARTAGDRVAASLDIRFDRSGLVSAEFTLSTYVAATGVIASSAEGKPKGTWVWSGPDGSASPVVVTEKVIRGLARPLKDLACQPGDRIRMVFNTWDRSVEIASVKD